MPAPSDDTTLLGYLNAVAARTPTPGGGSVAGVTGALATAIATMAVRYSQGKKSLAGHEPAFAAAVAVFEQARALLLQLTAEDEEAFAEYQRQKKQADAGQAAEALAVCIRVPETIGSTAVALLRTLDGLVDKTNLYLLSDLAVAAELAAATVRCAGHNVRVNVPELPDAAARKAVLDRADHQRAQAVRLVSGIVAKIEARQQEGT